MCFTCKNTAMPNQSIIINLSLNLVMGKVYELLCLLQGLFNLYFINNLLKSYGQSLLFI